MSAPILRSWEAAAADGCLVGSLAPALENVRVALVGVDRPLVNDSCLFFRRSSLVRFWSVGWMIGGEFYTHTPAAVAVTGAAWACFNSMVVVAATHRRLDLSRHRAPHTAHAHTRAHTRTREQNTRAHTHSLTHSCRSRNAAHSSLPRTVVVGAALCSHLRFAGLLGCTLPPLVAPLFAVAVALLTPRVLAGVARGSDLAGALGRDGVGAGGAGYWVAAEVSVSVSDSSTDTIWPSVVAMAGMDAADDAATGPAVLEAVKSDVAAGAAAVVAPVVSAKCGA